MNLGDLTSASAVRKTIREFDRLGEDVFLAKNGYGPAKKYFLIFDGARHSQASSSTLDIQVQARNRKFARMKSEELKVRASAARKLPTKRAVTSTKIVRDQAGAEYVKRIAKGPCDLCRDAAPFKDKFGHPYLECHHVIRLADDGEDSVKNAIALCANCDRKMHILNLKVDRIILRKQIGSREK